MKKNSKLLLIMLSMSWSMIYMQDCPTATELIPRAPNFSALPKRCKVKILSEDPYILCVYDFITNREAKHIKQIAQPLMQRSLVIGPDKHQILHPDRTSSSAMLQGVSSQIAISIRERAAAFLNTIIQNVEDLQVVHYVDSQKYEPHWDFFIRSHPSAKIVIGGGGQRIATMLVYLNDVDSDAGAETFFPKVLNGLKIKPKKNLGVFWYNVLPNGIEDERTLHGGLPIKNGEKWAINVWIRDPRLVERPASK